MPERIRRGRTETALFTPGTGGIHHGGLERQNAIYKLHRRIMLEKQLPCFGGASLSVHASRLQRAGEG